MTLEGCYSSVLALLYNMQGKFKIVIIFSIIDTHLQKTNNKHYYMCIYKQTCLELVGKYNKKGILAY